MTTISKYANSVYKRVFDIFASIVLITLSLPLYIVISIILKITSKGPIFFLQNRVGLNGKIFKIIKFRTMTVSAPHLQTKYKRLNESDGPVFKIANDPRFTSFGKVLSRTGLDELPQFLNVFLGQMSMVGPRPLPTKESDKLKQNEKIRLLVKPGVTSPWVVKGSHRMSFKDWMHLDQKYVKETSFTSDLLIIYQTFYMVLISILKLIFVR